tara:strand:+ start:4813 stop:7260 length:2448 start_codon:yes stop_codon:yes gene_type:complete
MKIQFYPLDFTYKVIDGRPEVLIFGKTLSNDPICVIDKGFKPYFHLILIDDVNTEEFIKEFNGKIINDAEIKDIQVVEKNYLDKPVKTLKIITKTPKQIPIIARFFKDYKDTKLVFESDIRYVNRYIIDKKLTPTCLTEVEGKFIDRTYKSPAFLIENIHQVTNDTIKDLRVLSIDIETYSPFGKAILPEKNPILMIAFSCKDFRKVLCWKRFKTYLEYVEFVDSEAALLERFNEIIKNYRPDIITGYYSDVFDLPYIRTRAEKYNIRLDMGLDHSGIKSGRGANKISRIIGMVHVDIFQFIKKIMSRSLETDSYSLNEVSKEILGEKKLDVDVGNLSETWDNNPEKIEEFCRYNLQDAELTLKLFNKIFPNIEELVKIIGLPLFRITRMSYSQLVENFIMKRTTDFNELIPNKPYYQMKKDRAMSTYKGGFVYEPKPGLYKDIAIVDFRSFYPSVIVSHNISPSTVNCDCCKNSNNAIVVDENKFWFCENKKGFISSILEEIVTRRMRVKEILRDSSQEKKMLLYARSEALKLLSNAFYGYMAFSSARWYCVECAKSITGFCREYILKVIDKAKEKGFGILYSDTDSVFILLNNKTKDNAKTFCDEINKSLPSLMELEFEDYFTTGIFVSIKKGNSGAKKRYALLGENGVIKVKGFESVRRNISMIAKQTQKEVLNIVLIEGDAQKAFDYVKDVVKNLRLKKVPKEKVIIYTQLQKKIDDYEAIGPHVAAAMRMITKGYDVGPGSLIKYVVVVGKGKIRDRARLSDEVKQEDYDAEYYIKNQVVPAVEKIFEVLDYDVNELLEEQSQSKLSGFV